MIYIIKKDKFLLPILIAVVFFFIWDIGNIEAMRQGTEGFYLQISKEMFNNSSFITPLYQGNHHWSKPPIHFWFPWPIYLITGQASIWAARLSMVFVSLFGLLLIGSWTKRHFNIAHSLTIIFLAASFAFLKYSRIYMMEIPLCIFSTAASLIFYDYLSSKKKTDLLYASILLAIASLVKGPVALIMCAGGGFLFLLCRAIFFKEKRFLDIFIWLLFGTLAGAIWYLICFYRYGQEFFQYFFIRENMGKFVAKPYPIRSVIQGLFLYSLPWSLFIPITIISLKQRWQQYKLNQPLLFLACNFLVFFILWIIPSQRSHHYAIPSMPFFLLLLLILTFTNIKEFIQQRLTKNIFRISSGLIIFVVSTLVLVIISSLFFEDVRSNPQSVIRVSAVLLSFLLAIIAFKSQYLQAKFLSVLLIVGTVWTVFMPVFYLSTVPQKTVDLIGTADVVAAVRKPYFVSETLGREVTVLGNSELYDHMARKEAKQQFYIVHESQYKKYHLHEVSQIVTSWPIWIRGNKAKDILRAYRQKSLKTLQEKMVLLERKNYIK